jgi:hypothetical protein
MADTMAPVRLPHPHRSLLLLAWSGRKLSSVTGDAPAIAGLWVDRCELQCVQSWGSSDDAPAASSLSVAVDDPTSPARRWRSVNPAFRAPRPLLSTGEQAIPWWWRRQGRRPWRDGGGGRDQFQVNVQIRI